jgi:peroxiredoxin
MENEIAKIDSLIVKQAVRDVASKNPKLSKQAVLYFYSKDFLDLCSRNKIDSNAITRSIKELVSFPMISKKKIANDIAKIIDSSFVREV